MPSPFTGDPVQIRTSHLKPTNLIFYVFEGAPRFGVLADRVDRGFPLAALITRNGWAELDGSVTHKPPLRRLLNLSGDKRWRPGARALAVVGHVNFAHGFWNEFPALDLALSRGRVFDLATAFDPLLLFRRHADRHGLDRQQIPDPHGFGRWTSRPVTHLSGVHCDHTAKASLLATLFGETTPRPSRQPTVYFSVRNAGRTATNQTEFLAAAGQALARAVGGLRILIDGFSLPSDIEEPAHDAERDRLLAKVQRAREITAAIGRRLRALPEAPEVIDLTGLRLVEALPLIGQSHFYLTHAGTSHHKIGWLFPVPGVVHSNITSLSPESLGWHGSNVAGSSVPVGLPAGLVRTLDTTDMVLKSPRNMDYVIEDVEAAAEFVTRQCLAALAGTARALP